MTASATRVVITGADVLCPLGSTWPQVERALRAGCSGVGPITAFDASGFPVHIAAQVRDWTPPPAAATRVHGMALQTATRAVQQAGLRPDAQRTAVCMGVGKVPIRLESVAAPVDAEWELARDYEFPVRAIARAFECRGPIVSVSSACATGNDAIGLAAEMLRRGDADAVIAGAADAPIAPLSVVEYLALGALAQPRSGERHPRPFDRGRNGFVLGEGAATFVLETLEGARRRGATPLAEVAGYGASSDAYSLVRSHPQSDGPVAAITAALADARVEGDRIDYVNAHGTGTLANDQLETLAIKRAFGSRAPSLPISSTKSMTGHLLAASAAVECAFAIMMLHGRFIPPTINLDAPDHPDCDLDYVPGEARALDVTTIMSNAFGFGGQNAVLVLAKIA